MVTARMVFIMALAQFFLWFAPTARTLADTPRASLRLDRHRVAVTDTVTLRVVVEGSGDTSSPPTLLNMDGFTVTSTGSSSSFKMINGSVSSSIEYGYLLAPNRPGNFTIGPAEVNVDGKRLVTGVEHIKVTKAPVRKAGPLNDVFLRASISSKIAVPEQPLVYTLKLWHRVAIRNPSLNLPESPEFDLKKAGDPVEYDSRLGDFTYHVIELKYILIPLKTGVVEVPPALVRMEKVSRRPRVPGSLFDDPFFSFGRAVPFSASSSSLRVQVRDFPGAGRPADFSGLVGKYDMDVVLDPDHVRAGASATLTVTIKGTGNVQRIPTLRLPDIPGCRVYADEPVFESSVTGDGIYGKKVMKWAIVPEKSGKFLIPETGFSYYDLRTGKYERLVSQVLSLDVKEGAVQAASPPAPVTQTPGARGGDSAGKHEIAELGRDIFPVHPAADSLVQAGRWLPLSWLLALLLLLPPLCCALVFLVRFVKDKRDHAAVRAERAARMLERKCRDATGADELLLAIRDYINSRFNREYGSITPDDVELTLEGAGVRQDVTRNVREIVSMLEQAVYACRSPDNLPVRQLLDNVKKIEEGMK